MQRFILAVFILLAIAGLTGAGQSIVESCKPGDLECAISDVTLRIRQFPEQFDLYLLRARLLRKKGDCDSAISDLSIYISKNADQPRQKAEAFNERAFCLKDLERYDDALRDNDEAVKLEPGNAGSLANRGETHGNKREWQLALNDLNSALKLEPDNSFALATRGWIYRWMQNDKQAFADFNKAIGIDPTNAIAYYRRAFSYKSRGEFTKAIADFDRFFALQSNEVDFLYRAYLTRGELNSDAGYDDRAMADFNKAVELKPKSPLPYKWKAYVYRRLGDKANAEENEKIAERLEKDLKARKK